MAALPVEIAPEIWELFDVSLAPTAAGLESYFERVLLHCQSAFKASAVSLFLRMSEPNRFHLVARNGSAWRIPDEAVIETGVGFAGEAIQKRLPAVVQVPSEVRNVGSAMVVPLVMGGTDPLGILNLSREVGEPSFGKADLRYANSVARQIALAVGNARLYSEAREAEARLNAILQAIPTPMFVLSAEGKVTDLNGPAKALLSPPPPGIEGRCEHGGRTYWVQSQPIPTGGSVRTVDDVTDRERAAQEEAQLRHLAEIGQMTATIAHEIRNPLTGIKSAAQMMSEAPELAGEWSGIIGEEARRMEDLCDQFLEYARPLSLDLAPLELSQVAREVAQLFAPMVSQAGITLEVELQPGPPVLGDQAKLRQVLQNLIRNAVQATQAGGKVSIRSRESMIEVEDTGQGMTADEMKRAGQPFFTTKTRGSGLGLSTSRKIVEAHSGQLNVESTYGVGTKIVIDLSRAQKGYEV